MAKDPNEMQKVVNNLCSQKPVTYDFILEDIRNAINDDLESGETALQVPENRGRLHGHRLPAVRCPSPARNREKTRPSHRGDGTGVWSGRR